MKKKMLVSLIVVLTLILNILIIFHSTPGNIEIENENSNALKVVHAAIRINNDTDFATQASANGWAGNGTASNPYVIANYTIDAQNKGPAIYIGNTTVYFIIKNCTLYNTTTSTGNFNEPVGIRLANVQHAEIYSCIIHDVKYGLWENNSYNISVENSRFYNFTYEAIAFTGANGVNLIAAYNNIQGNGSSGQRGVYYSVAGSNLKASVKNNTINDTYYGIYLGLVYGVNITGNIITNTSYYGIYADQGGNIIISNNTLKGLVLSPNEYEPLCYIYMEEANDFNISYNTITDLSTYGSYGIYLDTSTNGSMYGNTFTNASIYIKEGDNGNYGEKYYTSHTIASSNTINGKPILFKKNVNLYSLPIATTQYSELILVNVSNIVINAGNFSHYGFGIVMAYDSHALISGVSFYYVFCGISVEMSNNVTIENVVMNHVEYTGLNFEYNDYYKIENITVTDIGNEYYGGYGMYFAGYLNLGNNLIANNTITGTNCVGMEIDWGGNVTITNNTINGENRTPVYKGYYSGIMAYKNNDNVTIENNTISGVIQGIYSDENSDNYTVTNNTIFDTEYGIYSYYDEYYGNYVRPVFSNNKVYNTTYGLYGYATNISVVNNEFYNCEYGMYLNYYTWYSVFLDNTLNVTQYGIYISDGYHNRFYNNTLLNGGFYLAPGSYEYSFTVSTILPENNTVNGKPVYYLFNTVYSTPTILNASAYGQVLLAKVTNLTVENLSVNQATVGLEAGLSKNIIVKNGVFSNNTEAGVEFYATDSSKIENCIMQTNPGYGVYLNKTQNNIILNVTVKNGLYGVYLNKSNLTTVKYGNMDENKYGIYLLNSNSNIITAVNTSGNIIGLYLNNSATNTIYSLSMTRDSIFLKGPATTYTSQTIPTNNTVNGNSVYYLKNADLTGTIVPSTAGEVIGANVISLSMTSGSLSNATVGMILFNVSTASISNVRMSNNTLFGAYVLNSTGVTVENGSFIGENCGIIMSGSASVTLKNNTIGSVSRAVFINNADTIDIFGNHIDNANIYGINISNSQNVTVRNNTVSNTPKGMILNNINGLIGKAYYPLDEGAGTAVVDHSGNGYNGNIVNGTWVKGRTGYAIHFNGTGYADIPMTIDYNQLTVVLWFKADNLSNGNARLIANSHTDIDKKGFQIMFNSSGQNGFFDVGNGTAVGNAYWNYSLKTGVWYMAALVYDGSTVKAYINDTLVGETAFAGGAIAASGYDVMLGRNPVYSNADFFNGSIDNVHIYAQALGYAEIKELYLNGGGIVNGLSVHNNTVFNATTGITLKDVHGAAIYGNAINLPSYTGAATPVGVYAENSDNMEIFNSSVNGYYYDVQYTNIAYSSMHNVKIGNSTSYGVYVDANSHNNIFYNNSFYFNNGSNGTYNASHIQAYDAGHNSWNTPIPPGGTHGYGNFWYDWQTPDSNNDGIVDNPYNITGGAVDYYPLTTAPVVPVPEFESSAGVLFLSVILFLYVFRRKLFS